MMFERRLLVAALIAAALCAACNGTEPVQTDVPSGKTRYVDTVFTSVSTQSGIQYGASVPFGSTTAAPLRLDLYQPEGDTASARPVLVWIHGGGFVSGTPTDGQIPRLARSLALRGYVSVSISYRLRTPATFNADQAGGIRDAVHDARAAVRWVRANARAFRFDTACIGFVGSSAGAITALTSTYDQSLGEGMSGNPGFSSRVKTVVDFWGSLPQATDSVMQAGEPPLLIFHGTEDTTVPYVEAQQLVARATQVGIPHRLVTLTGQGHAAWNNVPLFETELTTFLSQRLMP
jgi:acetyl esterase/lipase